MSTFNLIRGTVHLPQTLDGPVVKTLFKVETTKKCISYTYLHVWNVERYTKCMHLSLDN